MTLQQEATGGVKVWIPVSRPGFTVVMKADSPGRGIRYSADHISMGISDGDLHPTITFQCSGRMYTEDAAGVETVEYSPSGRQYCNACDQMLAHQGNWVEQPNQR